MKTSTKKRAPSVTSEASARTKASAKTRAESKTTARKSTTRAKSTTSTRAKDTPARAPGKSRKSYKPKTTVTAASVDGFIATVDSEARRADAHALVKLFKRVSGWEPKMWGPAIIGFGAYHYTYESGHSGSICALGFSPRKANFAIYVVDFPGKEALLAKLGKHKGGIEQCLYINRVADVDLDVLGRILAGGLAQLKKLWPVTAA